MDVALHGNTPVICIGNGPGRAGIPRYRPSKIQEFIAEQEGISLIRSGLTGRRIA